MTGEDEMIRRAQAQGKQKAEAGLAAPSGPARRWRFIPKISYLNWHKEHTPNMGLWREWFSVTRMWSGKLIYISMRHHQITLDFRRDWMADMRQVTGS